MRSMTRHRTMLGRAGEGTRRDRRSAGGLWRAAILACVASACTPLPAEGTGTPAGDGASPSASSKAKTATFRVWHSVDLETGSIVESGSGDGDVALVINPSVGITAVLTATGPAPEFKGFIKDFAEAPALPGALDGFGEWFGMVGIAEGDHLLALNRTHDRFYHVTVEGFVGSGENHTNWEVTLSWEPIEVAVDDVRRE